MNIDRLFFRAFAGTGALVMAGGVEFAFSDPRALFLIPFGAVFVGAGYLARSMMRPPEGKRRLEVRAVELPGFSRRTFVHVDEHATSAEEQEARREWLAGAWAKRADWVSGRIEPDGSREGVTPLVVTALLTVFVVGLIVASVLGADLWPPAIVLGIVDLMLLNTTVRAALHRRAFAESLLVLDPCPAILGERLRARLASGVPVRHPLRDGFAVRLRCVNVVVLSTGVGAERRSHNRYEVLWDSGDLRVEPSGHDGRVHGAAIALDVPADRPPSELGGAEAGVRWELRVAVKLPGIDYEVTFQVPVLAREEAREIRAG